MKKLRKNHYKKRKAMFTDAGKSANHPIQTVRKVRLGNFLIILREYKAVCWTRSSFRDYFTVELLDENYHGPRYETYKLNDASEAFKSFFKVAKKNIGADLYSDHLGLGKSL